MAMQAAGRRVALAVGIIIVAVGTVAVISMVKQRGETARHNDTLKIAAEERLKQAESESGAHKKNSTDTQGVSGSASAQAEQKDHAQSSERASTAQDTATAAGAAELPQTGVSELPQTGVMDGILAIPAGLVTFALVSYYRSRRLLV